MPDMSQQNMFVKISVETAIDDIFIFYGRHVGLLNQIEPQL